MTYGSPTPEDLRAVGLMVAVHNDYRLGGVFHTFWLMTLETREPPEGSTVAPHGQVETGDAWKDAAVHGMQWGTALMAFKGEGQSDAEALDQIRAAWEGYSDALTATEGA